ncbi:cobaltochelatase subunit CobN [Aquibium sp. A9E412]|uniref:cobaltochelatase subunit CobN n=1 Tax=Aquibium sp. A9E412 TaxID=2976767 RepID=UPI0025AF6149|nr:cobaltochelatase subunit CobN [Aquibium sp. A9E412]MDN2565854.1 cobaltochelatase subunit CobN [Aquibium sp. A9E412]
MHILATSSASLDDLVEPVDLGQSPAEMVALSFTDSDLAGIAAAWRAAAGPQRPTMRLASLRDLRHPMSVDLWLESVAAHARVILVRVLGGYDWWRYGCDRLAALAQARGIALVLLPGECREADERLAAASTLPAGERAALLACFREGGPGNMRVLVDRLSVLAGRALPVAEARPLPRAGFYDPARGIVGREAALAALAPGAPVVPVLFYRSMLLAADVAPVDALAAALAERGLAPLPVFVASLKEARSRAFVEAALGAARPAAIVATTAFTAGAEPGAETLFDRAGVPVFQAVVATTRRDAWAENERGLAPADLAMHVVLPELDGRIQAGAVAFKDAREADAALGFGGLVNRPEPDRVEAVAERVALHLRLRATPPAERRIAVLLPDYPNAPGRTGYAVGLDVPESVRAILADLAAAGYRVADVPATARGLLDRLARAEARFDLADYRRAAAGLPAEAAARLAAAWGAPDDDADLADGAFAFRAATFGNVTVALAPERGRAADRRADYHDPERPPRHALVAFGLWLRHALGCHAIVHVGAHGTLEWLPGKTVALSAACFPEIVTGRLPVVYPFIVSNPGEAAHAKRRIAAVTLGHLPPPLTAAGLDADQQRLEQLVDEYAQADGLDRRRRDRLARLIVDTAAETGLAADAGVGDDVEPDEALRRIDAWLCDLKDFAVKDGQHVYGRIADGDDDALRRASATAERAALLAALDGRHVVPGPSGAPARGRTDVLPTGRNLFTADPRTMPTPTAFELGRQAADEVLRRYAQEHGEWPRALVIDLWGSASLRTGGEEIAQGLALMGCRPVWDAATGRVTGIEVQPAAQLGRPRVDVTFRLSGLFRDMFPAQIALLDAAVGAVAARREAPGDNPLAEAAAGAGDGVPPRIFGSAPGTYGAGIEELLADGAWHDRAELGRAYLDAASHAYGGADGGGRALPGAFAARVAEAGLLIHAGDDPGRDLLEGSADVAFVGGFAAAVAALGGKADLVALDTTDPARPRARSLAEAVARVVRARAVNPRFIAGQMRHGPRGAAEFAETVDRLVGFAETTHAVAPALIEAVAEAYLGDPRVRAFLLRESPAAACAIAERFAAARRRGLWHPRRNAVDGEIEAFLAAARAELTV